jgi:CheY-like chemotaxis protein
MAREENRLSMPLSPSADSSKLLVVEDDESIRELLASALRFAGYQAEAVPTGTDGFNRAINKRYDLLILDVGLPGIDGFEICRLLRARECSAGSYQSASILCLPCFTRTANTGDIDSRLGRTIPPGWTQPRSRFWRNVADRKSKPHAWEDSLMTCWCSLEPTNNEPHPGSR